MIENHKMYSDYAMFTSAKIYKSPVVTHYNLRHLPAADQ